jgi:hypothetical protein
MLLIVVDTLDIVVLCAIHALEIPRMIVSPVTKMLTSIMKVDVNVFLTGVDMKIRELVMVRDHGTQMEMNHVACILVCVHHTARLVAVQQIQTVVTKILIVPILVAIAPISPSQVWEKVKKMMTVCVTDVTLTT